MAVAPKTALVVILSWKSMKPAIAANRGDVEEMGTARSSVVFAKLMFMRSQPTPFATSPPTHSAIMVLRFIFKKPCSLSMKGASSIKNNATDAILRVMMA